MIMNRLFVASFFAVLVLTQPIFAQQQQQQQEETEEKGVSKKIWTIGAFVAGATAVTVAAPALLAAAGFSGAGIAAGSIAAGMQSAGVAGISAATKLGLATAAGTVSALFVRLRSGGDETRSVTVRDVAADVQPTALLELFGLCGHVEALLVAKLADPTQGIAVVVNFTRHNAARTALFLNGTLLGGRRLRVDAGVAGAAASLPDAVTVLPVAEAAQPSLAISEGDRTPCYVVGAAMRAGFELPPSALDAAAASAEPSLLADAKSKARKLIHDAASWVAERSKEI